MTADDTTPDDVRAREDAEARRGRMRDSARSFTTGGAPRSYGYQTPQWLDRSFVLPLTEPEGLGRPETTEVPNQSVPHHDDFEQEPVASEVPEPGRAFVRPPSQEIDFARVVRRADLSGVLSRTALVSAGAAGLLLILFLVTDSAFVLGLAITLAVTTLVALGVRLRLATTAVPHLES